MKLTSTAFNDGEAIPRKYSCQGENINPPLLISAVPKEAKSLALILEDPDVPLWVRPDRLFIHWVVYNIKPTVTKIEEKTSPFAIYGKNTEGESSYTGPCPPDREHRYFFTLFALDSELSLSEGATKDEVMAAMEGHVLTKTQLMGTYVKS